MGNFKDKRPLYIGIAIASIAVIVAVVMGVLILLEPPVSIRITETKKVTSRVIKIYWSDEYDNIVSEYEVKRRDVDDNSGNWKVVANVTSDGKVNGNLLSIEDVLDDTAPQQYIYRIDVKSSNSFFHKFEVGKETLASNVLICLDPGHYTGRNQVEGDLSYGYAEGDFLLDLGLELRTVLKEKYGIDVYMTRHTEHITIQGYTDLRLDSGHISLRGKRAAYRDSDMFVSLHTNANSDDAHGYETCMQPLGMNKPMVLVNTLGCVDPTAIAVSNSAGVNLAKANYALGTSSVEEFVTVEPGAVEEWTGKKNDALDEPGTVYYRHKKDEETDYYGVLRGSALVKKPGILIEHGFHTVAEMRKEAMEGDLKTIWANIDAYAIAYGFGFESKMEMTDVLAK